VKKGKTPKPTNQPYVSNQMLRIASNVRRDTPKEPYDGYWVDSFLNECRRNSIKADPDQAVVALGDTPKGMTA
jgi:hypothetical protein